MNNLDTIFAGYVEIIGGAELFLLGFVAMVIFSFFAVIVEEWL
jgi:hypothetical protein